MAPLATSIAGPGPDPTAGDATLAGADRAVIGQTTDGPWEFDPYPSRPSGANLPERQICNVTSGRGSLHSDLHFRACNSMGC
jgi:hypothetical protein